MKKRLTFTETLKRAVSTSELSLGQMAEHTGIDKSVLSRFARGQTGLAMPSIDRLCELLGLELVETKRPNNDANTKGR